MSIQRRRAWIIAAAAVAVLMAGGIAYATIPDAGGMIHGCYQKEHGQLRVVANAADCLSNEAAISWSQTGPPGPAGAPATTKLSRIEWDNGGTSVVATTTPQLVDTAGTFTKAESSTRLKLTWQGSAFVGWQGTAAVPDFQDCEFFLKIDSEAGRVQSWAEVVYPQPKNIDSMTLVDYFDSIPAGVHTVTIWTKSEVANPRCGNNAGGLPETIFVEEMPAP